MNARTLIAFVVTAAAAALVGRVAASTVLPWLEGGRAADVRSQQTSARYASATEYYQAKLADGAAATVRALRDSEPLAVVMAVRRQDVETCEDLGRQLREFRRALGPNRRLIVLSDPADVPDVKTFFVNERIAGVVVAPTDLARLYPHTLVVPTPAVLLVDRRDSVVQGVAHPLRFPDARVRSFASELTALGGNHRDGHDGGT